MKRHSLLFFVCLMSFFSSKAGFGLIGGEVGIGPMYNANTNFFPGLALNTTAGFAAGYMIGRNTGIISGCYLSYYNFDIEEDAPVGKEKMYYLDVPLSVRFIANNHKRTKAYIQPGVTFGSLIRAHYSPIQSYIVTHTTYEQNNNYEFHPFAIKPFIQMGLLVREGNVGNLNIAMALSFATQNSVIASSNKYITYKTPNIQGYEASMAFTSFTIKLGYQFNVGKHKMNKNRVD